MPPSVLEVSSDGSEKEIIWPKLGEIHFICGMWDVEIVSHEVGHAVLHKIRMIGPSAQSIIDQDGSSEEDFCYLLGTMALNIYKLLWDTDPTISKKRYVVE